MRYKESILKKIMEFPQKRFTKVALRQKLDLTESEIGNFNKALNELVKENVIIKTKKGKYCVNKDLELFIGKFLYNTKNYGFCIRTTKVLEGELKEVFIPPHYLKNALHEDIVAVKITKDATKGQKAEGEIVSILERKVSSLVGTYIKEDKNNFGFVVPDNSKFNMDIYIPEEKALGAKSYDKVVVRIEKYPTGDKKPEGAIKEVIGFKADIGVDYLSLITEYGFKETFSPKAINQVDRISETIDKEELRRRKDLTNMCIFTIDGEDTKDLDDAISIEKLKDGTFKLGVHIADVTHYVKEDSPLDKDALNRGTSVYLINKVIPMLPKKLSNNLCSLNPNETKLTLSVFMNINKKGNVTKHEIVESYINSKSKLWYSNVSNFLEKKDELKCNLSIKDTHMEEEMKNALINAKELALILERKRAGRGALDFQFDESKITLDENDKPIDIKAYERRIANDIIEEFMIVTNEVVAEHFNKLEIPFVYRVHENPKEEKLANVLNFIKELDYEMPTDFSPKSLQNILLQAKGKGEEEAINLLLLQSMQQARYYPIEIGHFGLGATYYSHFTSPIRRYPDLQIHRIIKDYLNGRLNNVKIEKLKDKVDYSSRISSKRERQAQSAEMEYDNIKKAEYMEGKIDQEFEGIITNISKTSYKVILPNTVEGVISLRSAEDNNFSVLQEGCSLVDKEENKLTIGDKIRVKLIRVSLEEQLIIFKFIEKIV